MIFLNLFLFFNIIISFCKIFKLSQIFSRPFFSTKYFCLTRQKQFIADKFLEYFSENTQLAHLTARKPRDRSSILHDTYLSNLKNTQLNAKPRRLNEQNSHKAQFTANWPIWQLFFDPDLKFDDHGDDGVRRRRRRGTNSARCAQTTRITHRRAKHDDGTEQNWYQRMNCEKI